jgi:hypothetical protein
MSNLSAIGKKIIQSRLLDKGIIIDTKDLDNYILNTESFTDNNQMYDFIVNNYGTLVIE